jgi:ectoine hydroxylase-related dioxygenase (phytanoyl-CoA dioxygenase family)
VRALERRHWSEFFEQGFVVQPGVFGRGEIAEMRAAFDRLQEIALRLGTTQMHAGSQFVLEKIEEGEAAGSVRIHRIVWCGAAEPVLGAYGRDPRLLSTAADLLGSDEMNHLINQAHFKLPGDGVEFPWHQDSTHRRFGRDEWRDVNGRGSYVQTVVALDDVTEENGPLRFIAGSCTLGHLDLPADGELPREALEAGPTVEATMEAGSVLLFGPYSIHSSLPNRSNRSRRTLINGFGYPGANSRVYPGDGAGCLVSL